MQTGHGIGLEAEWHKKGTEYRPPAEALYIENPRLEEKIRRPWESRHDSALDGPTVRTRDCCLCPEEDASVLGSDEGY